MWRNDLEKTLAEIGYKAEYLEGPGVLCGQTQDEKCSLYVFQRPGPGAACHSYVQWVVPNRTCHFFRLRDGTRLRELLERLYRERTGWGVSDGPEESWSPIPEVMEKEFGLERVHPDDVDALLKPHLEGGLLYFQYLADKFGFRRYSESEAPLGLGLAQAKALVEESRGGRPIQFDPARVVCNDDLIYVPFTFMGCVGYIVERRSRRVIGLGSGTLPHKQIWAYYRGFSFGESNSDRLDTLVIMAIHDLEKTKEVLHQFLRSNAAARRLAKLLDQPPCAVEGVDLLVYINQFFEAEEKGYFDFEINAKTAADRSRSG